MNSSKPVHDTFAFVFHISMALMFWGVVHGYPLTQAASWTLFGIFALTTFTAACKVIGHIRSEWNDE